MGDVSIPLADQFPEVPTWKLREVASGRMIWGVRPADFGSMDEAAAEMGLTPEMLHRVIQRAADVVRAREARRGR